MQQATSTLVITWTGPQDVAKILRGGKSTVGVALIGPTQDELHKDEGIEGASAEGGQVAIRKRAA